LNHLNRLRESIKDSYTISLTRSLLGHVYTVTTMVYAKVDLTSLRELVVPFGQVPR
jgi:hypothetical protein